jgi:hypothetical protein
MKRGGLVSGPPVFAHEIHWRPGDIELVLTQRLQAS